MGSRTNNITSRRPRHGTIVAYLALFIALGGSSYAATQLGSARTDTASIAAKKKSKRVRGPAGRSALAPLHGGETIHGAWALVAHGVDVTGITFPIPASQPVDSYHAVVQGNDTEPGDGCTGAAAAPVAAPGFVCIYFGSNTGTANFAYGIGALSDASTNEDTATGDGSPYGFMIKISGSPVFTANGTWAYTAP